MEIKTDFDNLEVISRRGDGLVPEYVMIGFVDENTGARYTEWYGHVFLPHEEPYGNEDGDSK